MYPKYLYDNLGCLDWLLEEPEPSEIDDSGFLSSKALANIENAIKDDLLSRMKGYEPDPSWPLGKDVNNRWRTVSSMQKAIRFNMPEEAQFAASAASSMDEKYLFRRLGVTAVEDVGVGNLFYTLASLAILGSTAFRKKVGLQKLGCFMARELATGEKDRALCDLLIIADFNYSLPKLEWSTFSDDALINQLHAEADNNDMASMMCATWLLAGTKRYEGTTMPADNDRSTEAFRRLMVTSGMSRAFLYMADKTSSRLGESMFVTPLHVDNWLRQTKEITFRPQSIVNPHKVGKLLGAAYDMHTREGQQAISRFGRVHKDELAKFTSHALPGKERNMLQFGVFCAEGGLLDTLVVYEHVEQLRKLSLRTELSYSGLPPELHSEFIKYIQDNVESLNTIRRHVLHDKVSQA